MNLDLGQWIVIALCAILFIWYFIGSSINRRRGLATYRWLRRSLEPLGEITDVRWLGSSSSGAQLVVKHAAKPFRRVEVVFVLETREILPYWIVTHLWGKRDEISINASLRKAPFTDVKVWQKQDREYKQFLLGDQNVEYKLIQSDEGFQIAVSSHAEDQELVRIREFMLELGDVVKQISLQPDPPHLMIKAKLKPLLDISPQVFSLGLLSWLSVRDD